MKDDNSTRREQIRRQAELQKRQSERKPQSNRLYRLETPRGFVDTEFWRQAGRHQFAYSMGGLALGLSAIIGGIVLFFHGVTGSTSWTAKFLGASSQISDAAPGVVLFVVGLFIIYVTKFTVKAGHK